MENRSTPRQGLPPDSSSSSTVGAERVVIVLVAIEAEDQRRAPSFLNETMRLVSDILAVEQRSPIMRSGTS
jgi:hypothetical protein